MVLLSKKKQITQIEVAQAKSILWDVTGTVEHRGKGRAPKR